MPETEAHAIATDTWKGSEWWNLPQHNVPAAERTALDAKQGSVIAPRVVQAPPLATNSSLPVSVAKTLKPAGLTPRRS